MVGEVRRGLADSPTQGLTFEVNARTYMPTFLAQTVPDIFAGYEEISPATFRLEVELILKAARDEVFPPNEDPNDE